MSIMSFFEEVGDEGEDGEEGGEGGGRAIGGPPPWTLWSPLPLSLQFGFLWGPLPFSFGWWEISACNHIVL